MSKNETDFIIQFELDDVELRKSEKIFNSNIQTFFLSHMLSIYVT